MTRAMVVDYDEGCIAVDANGVFGTARLPTVERLTFEELLPINAVVRACERAGQWELAFDFMRQMEFGSL